MTESVIKRRIVVSQPGAALRVERIELTDDAMKRLTVGAVKDELPAQPKEEAGPCAG